MSDAPPPDEFAQLGAYEAPDAKRVLAALEAAGVPFEIEVDESPLKDPLRHMQIMLLMQPRGSQVVVYVPSSELARAADIAANA